MNKKGDWTLLQTLTIIAGIAAAIILFTIVVRISTKDKVEAYFAAKDAALLSDAILSAPQDVTVIYPKGTGYAWMNDALISLYFKRPAPGASSEFSVQFLPRGDIKVTPSGADGKIFFLVKKDGYYFVSANPEYLVDSKAPVSEEKPGDAK